MTNFISTFKINAAARAITAEDIVLRALYKSYMAKTEDKAAIATALINSAFSPITKPTKLANGAEPFQARQRTMRWVRYCLTNKRYSMFSEDEQEALLAIYNQVQFNA